MSYFFKIAQQCKLKNSRIIIIVFHENLTEMRYFAKSVLTTPFCICLDCCSTLIGEDCTCINYPHNFLSPGVGDGGGGGSASLVVHFQHSKRCT